MSKYNKLIAAVVGNVVAILIAWLAIQFPAFAECTAAPAELDIDQVCTVFGFSQAQVTAALMLVVNAIFVERWAANTP